MTFCVASAPRSSVSLWCASGSCRAPARRAEYDHKISREEDDEKLCPGTWCLRACVWQRQRARKPGNPRRTSSSSSLPARAAPSISPLASCSAACKHWIERRVGREQGRRRRRARVVLHESAPGRRALPRHHARQSAHQSDHRRAPAHVQGHHAGRAAVHRLHHLHGAGRFAS